MQASQGSLKYMLIQNRLLENSGTPDFTRGTLEGGYSGGSGYLYRLHANPDGSLQAYISQGEVLPAATRSFGGNWYFCNSRDGKILSIRIN